MNNELINTSLKTSLKGVISDEEKLEFINDKIPENGACIDLHKKDIFVKKFSRVEYDDSICLFEELVDGSYHLVKQLKNEEEVQEFLRTHAIIEVPKFMEKPLTDVALEYFIPK